MNTIFLSKREAQNVKNWSKTSPWMLKFMIMSDAAVLVISIIFAKIASVYDLLAELSTWFTVCAFFIWVSTVTYAVFRIRLLWRELKTHSRHEQN